MITYLDGIVEFKVLEKWLGAWTVTLGAGLLKYEIKISNDQSSLF